MNLSRFAVVFLAIVPTVLFIAAAETAPDPAPASAPPQEKAAPGPAQKAPDASAAQGTPAAQSAESLPLRTAEPAIALPGTDRADASATSAILSAIRTDPGMAGADVSVHTDNGVVTLTGVVRNREQAAIASAYANRQLGVLRVENELSIPAQ